MEMKSRGMTSKEVKILLRFFISFVIILLFQMNMLKLLLIYKKNECFIIFDDRGGKNLHTRA